MITGIAYVEMRVRDLDGCRAIYGREMGLTEVQDTTAVLTEKGEWVSSASAESGDRESILQVGDSFLVLHEDAEAPTQVSPNGDVDRKSTGSVGHYAFFVDSNQHAYFHMKGFFQTYRHVRTKDGPSVQPMNHAYMQRTLLEFADPNGYTIQISEIVDPRLSKQDRRKEKADIANMSTGGPLKGFDHLNMSCPDINAAKELYADKLGLSIIDHSDNEAHESYVFVAGMCDIEMGYAKTEADPERLGKGVVGSIGLWTDDVDGLTKDIGHPTPPTERDLALGVPIRSITLDVGDGLPVEVAERLSTGAYLD